MTVITHRMEWNGNHWIIILDNGDHGCVEMTLDEFVALADKLKADLLLDDPPRQGRQRRQ